MKKITRYSVSLITSLLTFAVLTSLAFSYEEKDVSNGGSLSGTVTFAGPKPKVEALQITKDHGACGSGTKPSPRLVLSAGNEVANTVVRPVDIKSGKKLSTLIGDGVLEQKKCRFIPHIQIIPIKGKITIKNSDQVLHNIHAYLGTRTLFNLAMPLHNQVLKKKLKKPGVVRFQCDAGHTWMSAFAIVTDHPYVALTDNKGRYEIKDIPPGKYQVEFWHEGWKITEKQAGGAIAYSEPLISVKEANITSGGNTVLNFQLK